MRNAIYPGLEKLSLWADIVHAWKAIDRHEPKGDAVMLRKE